MKQFKMAVAGAVLGLATLITVGQAHAEVVGNPTVSVYGIHDQKQAQNGVRIEGTYGEFWRIQPLLSYTYVNDSYNRLAAGGRLNLVNVGAVNVNATLAGVYQRSTGSSNRNGVGLSAGLEGSVALTDSVLLVAGLERFIGESKVNDYDANLIYAGLRVRF